ncbi:MAG: hypothetical protein KatS3mg087_1584 [Patescibacteria group bacterium]|nr:MAG: hypothetical protein KatS3mg087_1584 [Patescibacteria group bacterium]
MARKSRELNPRIKQLEFSGFARAEKNKRRVAILQSALAPVGDEDLDQKDLRADGVHLNFGGMSESKIKNWRK